MAINNTLTITGYDPATGITHTVRGTGITRAGALAELQARAALEVLVKVRGSESMAMVPADYALVVFATGAFADAELTLTKGVGFTDKVIKLPNCTTSVLLANSKGQIDITNGLITQLATAYVDGDGVSGYVPLHGHFTE